MKTFDENLFYLGPLCYRNHNYENTGESLRYKSNRVCLGCSKENDKTDKNKKYHKIYNLSVSEKNKEKKEEYRKEYNQRKEVKTRNAQYQKNKRNSKIENIINSCISSGIYASLKGKKNWGHWEDLVGYTVEDLKQHLESLWEPWMSWGNYGKKEGQWSIDHIKPITKFNITDYNCQDFKDCWKLPNLRPLNHIQNISKGNKYYETKP